MRPAPNPESLPAGRGRRTLIALLILLLVLLPLYLWPLRGGISAWRGASAVSGPPRDPRDPAAVAGIPSEVWDALMERGAGGGPAGAHRRARNLTMITEHQLGTGPGGVDVEGPPSLAPGGSRFAVLLNSDMSGNEGSTPVHFSTAPSGDHDQGTGSDSTAFAFAGYSALPYLGPLNGGPGGGPQVVSLGPISDPGDHGVPAPTPEPATIVLIGSNVALFCAAMLRRRRRRQETDPSG